MRADTTTIRAYSAPATVTGRSSIAPAPPWFFAGRFVAVEFHAPADAVSALLPAGVLAEDPAAPRCTAIFYEWQWVSARGDEFLEPRQSQFREFVLAVDVRFDGRPMAYVPFMYVESDLSLARGWIQGLPKKLGSVALTRPYPPLDSPAAPLEAAGGRFAASLAAGDRRLADARVTLETRERSSDVFWERPLVCRRHFPSLNQDAFDRPAVYELVELLPVPDSPPFAADVWVGSGELTLFHSSYDELADLAPVRAGRGWHGYRTLSLAGSRLLRDDRREPGSGKPR